MSHASARSLRRAMQSITVASLLGVGLAPLAAGQIPNVRRRAADAAARAAGVQPQGEDVEFDAVMLELTPQRLDQVIKGLRARRAVLDGRNGAPSVGALVSRRDAARKDASELRDKSADAIAAYQSRESEVRQCREEAFRDKQSAREAANRDRAMSDPDFMMKLAELSQRLSEAQARGDTAAVRRLTEEFQNTYAAPTKADSVAVDRQCGRPPAPPPALARLDSLQALEARFTEQLRQREMEADTVGVQGSGLTAQQQAMAMERAEMYLSQSSAEVTYRGFTKVELDALHARRAELAELL